MIPSAHTKLWIMHGFILKRFILILNAQKVFSENLHFSQSNGMAINQSIYLSINLSIYQSINQYVQCAQLASLVYCRTPETKIVCRQRTVVTMIITSAVNRLQHCISDISCWMSANCLKLNTDKTELLWIGSKYNLSVLQGCDPVLRLGSDVVEPTDHAQLLEVTLSADLTLDRHVSSTSTRCFYWLSQLRRVRRSLDSKLAATHWLLQRRDRRVSESYNRQAATGAQRCGSCRHRNTEVRPRTDWHSPQRTSLAQRAAADQVQTRHHEHYMLIG